MTAFTLGEATAVALGRMCAAVPRGTGRATAALAPHRIDAPVRRDSMEAGTFEDLFFAVPAKGECDRMLRAARAALDAGRRAKRAARIEKRALDPAETVFARLTAGAVRVFEEVCTLARLNCGRVFPSYARLAAATALGRATVARALAALEAAGFLVHQRRFKRVASAGGQNAAARPRYAQTSNVYRPLLPARLVAHLPRWLRPVPIPDDVLQHAAERDDTIATMKAGLSARELAGQHVGGALGRMLARLGASIDAASKPEPCESHFEPETLPHHYITGEEASTWLADTMGMTTNKEIRNAEIPSQTPKAAGAPASPAHAA